MNSLDELMRPPTGRSYSANAENVTGAPASGAMDIPNAPSESAKRFGQVPDMPEIHGAKILGKGWKVRPWIYLDPMVETPLLDTDGPGIVRHLWFTMPPVLKEQTLLRMYWDNEDSPSVCVPLAHFFGNAPGYGGTYQTLAMCVNPRDGMNCYLPMPFRKHAKITVTSFAQQRERFFYYTVDFTKEPVADDATYLHSSFRTAYPVHYKECMTIADGISGTGRFAGCCLTWAVKKDDWWGEGEVKMYFEGDAEYPTICGTGTEDYFGGAWGFGEQSYSTPYCVNLQSETHGKFAGAHYCMMRFHLADPIYFHNTFRMTIQDLAWGDKENLFVPLEDDISAVAYWYQNEPHLPLPAVPHPWYKF